MENRVRYRKLPGHRRGFVRGASLWLGPDHILSVKSMRFREEYKRFHLRDIQSIVVARKPRYHFSTRAAAIVVLWGIAYLLAERLGGIWGPTVLKAGPLLVLLWIFVSHKRSCVCRIRTAVSAEELPSIYRTWTAERFLAQVTPRIAEAQGTLEPGWTSALENVAPPAAPLESVRPETTDAKPRVRTALSDIFLATLFADAIATWLALHSTRRGMAWVTLAFNLLEIAGAIGILVQRHRRVLRAGMQRLALATLLSLGLLYYVRPLAVGVAAGINAGNSRKAPLFDVSSMGGSGPRILWEIDSALTAALGLAGVAIVLFSKPDR